MHSLLHTSSNRLKVLKGLIRNHDRNKKKKTERKTTSQNTTQKLIIINIFLHFQGKDLLIILIIIPFPPPISVLKTLQISQSDLVPCIRSKRSTPELCASVRSLLSLRSYLSERLKSKTSPNLRNYNDIK